MERGELKNLKWSHENENFLYVNIPSITKGRDKKFIKDFGDDALIKVQITIKVVK